MVDRFTFLKKKNKKSYLYSSNLNDADISFYPLSINIKSLVKKTPITSHTHSAAQYVMIWQCYCMGTPGLIEDCHM